MRTKYLFGGFRLEYIGDYEWESLSGEQRTELVNIADKAIEIWTQHIQAEYAYTNDDNLIELYAYDNYKRYIMDHDGYVIIHSFVSDNAIHIGWFDDGCDIDLMVIKIDSYPDASPLLFHSSDHSPFEQLQWNAD